MRTKMIDSHKKIFLFLCAFFLSVLSTMSHALVFNIIPKSGVSFPTIYNGIGVATAYYTVSNNTASQRNNNAVKYLPPHVTQVTSNGTYADTCGLTFDLSATGTSGSSCTLQLSISGSVNGRNTTQENSLFICFPGGKTCAGTPIPLNVALVSPWSPVTRAFEIISIEGVTQDIKSFLTVYAQAGSNPINAEEWETYTPPNGYIKNTTRYLEFQEGAFIASPGQPDGSTIPITTPDGYTWLTLTNAINAMWPYDPSQYTGIGTTGSFAAGAFVTTPPAGVVKFTSNYKGQNMKFFATESGVPPSTSGAVLIKRYFITDPWGNRFIMHSSNGSTAEEVQALFDTAVLPSGWVKTTTTLTEDLILQPGYGPDNAYEYNLIRDSADNAYHQIEWGTDGRSVGSQIDVSGMPIWGGRNNDTIKITQSYDNLVYGGGGRNVFDFDAALTTGTNTIIGFDGNTGDRININGQNYTVIFATDGVKLSLSSGVIILLQGVFAFDNTWVTG